VKQAGSSNHISYYEKRQAKRSDDFMTGIVNLFQTFEDLESVKDKRLDIKAIRHLLVGDKSKESEDDNPAVAHQRISRRLRHALIHKC
jgi:hypothetical protein